MKVKYVKYEADGTITGITLIGKAPTTGLYLEDCELPQGIDKIEDFYMDYHKVQEVEGTLQVVAKTQTEKDAYDAEKLAESNTNNRKGATLDLTYDFFETLYKDWDNLNTEIKTVLAPWKTEMDTIWTNYPE